MEIVKPTAVRELTDHKVNECNDKLKIEAIGSYGFRYDITGFDTETNPGKDRDGYASSFGRLPVIFHNGPIGEAGANGVTNESLLAIIIDRLRSLRGSPYERHDSNVALVHLETAMLWLTRQPGQQKGSKQ